MSNVGIKLKPIIILFHHNFDSAIEGAPKVPSPFLKVTVVTWCYFVKKLSLMYFHTVFNVPPYCLECTTANLGHVQREGL